MVLQKITENVRNWAGVGNNVVGADVRKLQRAGVERLSLGNLIVRVMLKGDFGMPETKVTGLNTLHESAMR